jgi:hypothetical protein
MPTHALLLLCGGFVALVTTLLGAVVARVQLLPEVIDLSFIPTGSGIGSLVLVSYGALRRFEPERIGRLALLGTILGGIGTAAVVLLAALRDVIS